MTHDRSYFEIPAENVAAAAASFARSAGTPPAGTIPTADLIHSLRRHGIPASLKTPGARNAPPAEIEAAARRVLWVENNLSAPVRADIELVAGWVLACAPDDPMTHPAKEQNR